MQGAVTQTGVITTPLLGITSSGAETLNGTNYCDTIAIIANGNIVFTNASGFAIGTVGGISGINSNGNNLTLVAGGSGDITQSAALQNVNALSVSAGGAVVLDGSNTITSIGAVTAGSGINIIDTAGGSPHRHCTSHHGRHYDPYHGGPHPEQRLQYHGYRR